MSRKYTAEEIRKHNNIDDLWIVIHDKVYDLTKFLQEHPGGDEVLLNLAGKDGTTCFNDIGHSEEAKLLKDSYRIGEVVGSLSNIGEIPSKKESAEINDNWIYEEPNEGSSNYFYTFIGLAILIYAIIFYYIFYCVLVQI